MTVDCDGIPLHLGKLKEKRQQHTALEDVLKAFTHSVTSLTGICGSTISLYLGNDDTILSPSPLLSPLPLMDAHCIQSVQVPRISRTRHMHKALHALIGIYDECYNDSDRHRIDYWG